MDIAETNRALDGDADAVLPEHSLLSLEQYLAMQRAIGNETRFRIVNQLVERGAQSAADLREALDVESNTLHYHLDELVEVGLVENRKRKNRFKRSVLVLPGDLAWRGGPHARRARTHARGVGLA